MNFIHKTVLLNEAVEGLNCEDNKIYVDATAGGGGHSVEIARRIGEKSRLLAFDVDMDAISAATEKLKDFGHNSKIVNASYTQIPEILKQEGFDKITGGVLFDLGASYHQLTKAERGFSFSQEARLDMRFDKEQKLTAYDVVNKFSEKELADIFYKYGEERFSRQIAKKIIEKRKIKPIETTLELADTIKTSAYFAKSKIHPATRVFQALRIYVNRELQNIETTLQQIIPLLGIGARIVVISFHSLEDRIVKNIFREYSTDCKCPKEQMICKCEPKLLKIITKKPITPADEELRENPSARSSKLRIAERV